MDTSLLQHLDRISVLEDEGLGQEGELFVRELTLDDVDLVGVLLLESGKDRLEHPVDRLHRLVVVLFERHLEIESHELGQVTVSVRVFGTEDYRDKRISHTRRPVEETKDRRRTRTDLVDLLHISSDTHLLGELGRLGEESNGCPVVTKTGSTLHQIHKKRELTLEVRDTEDGSARLGSGTLELGRVDLDEPLSVEVVAEEVSDSRLDLEDGLVSDGLQQPYAISICSSF